MISLFFGHPRKIAKIENFLFFGIFRLPSSNPAKAGFHFAQHPTSMKQLHKYPVKILLAFDNAIQGKNEFFEWLLENGFPELAALSNAIRGNTKAIDWLMKNGYVHYAAFDSASVDDDRAMAWLENHNHNILALVAKASRANEEAIRILKAQNLEIFIQIARHINEFSSGQVFDHHKIPF